MTSPAQTTISHTRSLLSSSPQSIQRIPSSTLIPPRPPFPSPPHRIPPQSTPHPLEKLYNATLRTKESLTFSPSTPQLPSPQPTLATPPTTPLQLQKKPITSKTRHNPIMTIRFFQTPNLSSKNEISIQTPSLHPLTSYS